MAYKVCKVLGLSEALAKNLRGLSVSAATEDTVVTQSNIQATTTFLEKKCPTTAPLLT